MYSFFVLGLIPGTNFQITFQVWLDSLLIVTEIVCVTWLYRQRSLTLAEYRLLFTASVERSWVEIRYTTPRRFKAYLARQARAMDSYSTSAGIID
jgi:hypothetical protein